MSRPWVLVVLLAICVVAIALLGNIVTNHVPDWAKPYEHYAGYALLIVVGLWVALQLIEKRLQRAAPPVPWDQAQLKRNRRQMLARVRHDWIDGVLNQSLYRVARIDLGLEDKPDAVDHPLALVVQEAASPARSLPPRTRIQTVFDLHSGAGGLLILGEPGGGKTTLLLELAQDLLVRAEADETHPIPVVFNLSSWALHRPPLADWLAEELNQRYDVPRKLAERWVTTDQLLPLLDGLDEVAAEHRDACVERVNEYRNEHFLPIAVCSRTKEYEGLARRLRIPAAVAVQPLKRAQLEEYLERGGERLAGIRTALERDEALWELLDTPLMLSITMLAYHGPADHTILAGGTLEARCRHLFERYVDTMFNRRAKGGRYTREQTMHWLAWLASSMTRLDQSSFQLESLNRDWLLARRQRALLRWTVALATGLAFAIGGGLIGLLNSWAGRGVSGWLATPLLHLIAGPLMRFLPPPWYLWLFKRLLDAIVGAPAFTLPAGLAMGLILGLAFGNLAAEQHAAKPVDLLRWSWPRPSRSEAAIWLAGGLTFGLISWWSFDLDGWLGYALPGGLGALTTLLFVLNGGFTPVEVNIRALPNDGTWRSGRNTLVFVAIGGLCGALICALGGALIGRLAGGLDLWLAGARMYGRIGGLVGWLDPEVFGGLVNGLVAGLAAGSLVGMFAAFDKGAAFFAQHWATRLLLRCFGFAPFQYVRFLDFAAERVFLRKVGGGYIFVHRMLMEYFASLE